MILIKRLDLSLKNPKEKLIALFSQTAELKETDTTVTEQLSFCSADWDDETLSAVKRLLGLPIKKPLVYFRRIVGGWEQHPVASWEIIREYSDSCSVQIYVEELGYINIHHAFLSEMQKASFERDMKEQAEKIEE